LRCRNNIDDWTTNSRHTRYTINQIYFEEKSRNSETNDIQYCFICWHYEGIDERIFSFFDVEEFSLGEYVISSGELACLVWIDGIVRIIPWVIDVLSSREDSFSLAFDRKKEYPQYTRPEVFEGKSVPKELLSGDHQKIKLWKKNHLI
jgi:tRNA (guanine37-N1)-methyltransferase